MLKSTHAVDPPLISHQPHLFTFIFGWRKKKQRIVFNTQNTLKSWCSLWKWIFISLVYEAYKVVHTYVCVLKLKIAKEFIQTLIFLFFYLLFSLNFNLNFNLLIKQCHIMDYILIEFIMCNLLLTTLFNNDLVTKLKNKWDLKYKCFCKNLKH